LALQTSEGLPGPASFFLRVKSLRHQKNTTPLIFNGCFSQQAEQMLPLILKGFCAFHESFAPVLSWYGVCSFILAVKNALTPEAVMSSNLSVEVIRKQDWR
jgi:hypothetical protein